MWHSWQPNCKSLTKKLGQAEDRHGWHIINGSDFIAEVIKPWVHEPNGTDPYRLLMIKWYQLYFINSAHHEQLVGQSVSSIHAIIIIIYELGLFKSSITFIRKVWSSPVSRLFPLKTILGNQKKLQGAAKKPIYWKTIRGSREGDGEREPN